MLVETELFHRDTTNRHPAEKLVDLMRDRSETLRTQEVLDEAARSRLAALLSRQTLHLVQSPYFSPFRKAHVVSEVAANTQENVLIEEAKLQLKHAFPIDTGDIEKDRINARSRAEYAMAICATNQEVNFSEALSLAEVAGDIDAGEVYDDVIIRTEELKLQDIGQHRITEAKALEDDSTGDYADTVAWSPDDDEDDEVIEATMDRMVEDIYRHHLHQTGQQVA